MTIVFCFSVLMGPLTIDGWTTGPFHVDGARSTRSPQLRPPNQREDYNVHRVVTACSASPAAPARQPPTDERHVMDNDAHRTPSAAIIHGESVPFTPTVSRPLAPPVGSRPTSPVTRSQSVSSVGATLPAPLILRIIVLRYPHARSLLQLTVSTYSTQVH